MKDLIIGCINNYTPDIIKPWVESIIKSGFEGDKVVISFGLPAETTTYLLDRGFEVFESSLNSGEFIHNRRFLDIWHYLESTEPYRFVITTDVKDVIFQEDPTKWLKENLKKPVIASSEWLKVRDEEWNNRNILTNYPYIHPIVEDKEAFNVGVLAGSGDEFKHFSLQLYSFITTKAPGEDYADQAAFNCLIHMNHFKSIVQFAREADGWNCQLGTTLDPRVKEKYTPYHLEPIPTYDTEGRIYNSKNKLFCLVHQYDRVPELKNTILNKFK